MKTRLNFFAASSHYKNDNQTRTIIQPGDTNQVTVETYPDASDHKPESRLSQYLDRFLHLQYVL